MSNGNNNERFGAQFHTELDPEGETIEEWAKRKRQRKKEIREGQPKWLRKKLEKQDRNPFANEFKYPDPRLFSGPELTAPGSVYKEPRKKGPLTIEEKKKRLKKPKKYRYMKKARGGSVGGPKRKGYANGGSVRAARF